MGVDVRVLVEHEVAVLAALEPTGRDFAIGMWAAQQRGESVLLVAWVDDVPVGHGQLTTGVDPELRNLHVAAVARGHGVGTAIVHAAEGHARAAGAASLAVGVADDNPRARALYERLGYVGTGIRSTTTYDYVDDAGARRTATETDETLRRALG
ncbi:Acetyltransferase (GNAT) family protein [Agrococcus jejuensis]|uniref:Acetyltransferase (GNAT) family protein n=2 Tax=Agrococcus jejuensis TaxID=399736 RepID=A0A1G8E4U1_9MICO|nr:Acetyltransferase (GNAT) family protein [Agrococcus jejuensis]